MESSAFFALISSENSISIEFVSSFFWKNTDRPEGVPSYFSASVLSGSYCSEIEAPLLIGERPSR